MGVPETRSGKLKYTEGSWRFKVYEDIWFDLTGLEFCPDGRPAILSGLACIDQLENGVLRLHIAAGYAWDGASGPAIDTKNFRNGSLVHDVLYQMMRQEAIPESNRTRADQILKEICREDGMWIVRATWVYVAVRTCAKRSSKPEAEQKPATAP